MLDAARSEYRSLVKKCHPDVVSNGDEKLAERTFERLNELYRQVKDQIQNGSYGTASSSVITTITTKIHEYRVLQPIATGEVARLYKAEYEDKNGQKKCAAIKIALDDKDNKLIRNEQKILKKLARVLDPKDAVSLPVLIDTFETGDGKAASVLELIDGYDFEALLEHPLYENGLRDPYHIGWILERQLALLGHLHKNMIVHGNIEPRHLMLNPHNHNVVLLDFCFAVDSPEAGDYIHINTPDYSPPEIASKGPPLPQTDLYGLGKSMIYLLGGNPRTGKLPGDIPEPYVNFIRQLTEYDWEDRANDAWKMAYQLIKIRKDFGDGDFKSLPV